MELWASPKLTDWEGDGEGWLVKHKKPTNLVPEAREGIIPEGEQSTLLTAAGLNKMNY